MVGLSPSQRLAYEGEEKQRSLSAVMVIVVRAISEHVGPRQRQSIRVENLIVGKKRRINENANRLLVTNMSRNAQCTQQEQMRVVTGVGDN